MKFAFQLYIMRLLSLIDIDLEELP